MNDVMLHFAVWAGGGFAIGAAVLLILMIVAGGPKRGPLPPPHPPIFVHPPREKR